MSIITVLLTFVVMAAVLNCKTVSEVARYLRVKRKRIDQLIESGELRAFDLGDGKRHQYRIPADAVVEFENRHSAAQTPQPRRRRKKNDQSVIEYF